MTLRAISDVSGVQLIENGGGMNLESLLQALGNVVMKRELCPGDYVHHQGDYAETVSFVHSGQAVVEAYPIGAWEATPIRFVGPNGLIGEDALAPGDAVRSSTVRALCDLRLAVVYRDELLQILERSATQIQLVLQLVVASLHASQGALMASMSGSASQRVTRLLLHADESLGRTTGSMLHLTQQDLAHLARLQRPTANRVLKELEAVGWIETRRKRVKVLDRAAMEASLATE